MRKTIKLKHECGFNSHLSHLKYIWGRKELKEEEIVLPTKHSFVGKQASLMRVPGLTSWLEMQWLFFFSAPPGPGDTDKYKKSQRREAHPNPLHSGRDPGLLSCPKGQLCRNVLFAFLLSVNICNDLEGVSPVR